jgi:hypothetical protein
MCWHAEPTLVGGGSPARVAIVHGGILPEEARPPENLAVGLQRAARKVSKGITCLSEDGSECPQSYAEMLKESEEILVRLRKAS